MTIIPRNRVFISFGGGSDPYRQRVNQLCKQAESFGYFNKIYPYTDYDLMEDSYFWNKHGNFVSNPYFRRGYGYWLWKSYLLIKTIEKYQEGDILVYADAGCSFNPKGIQRMFEYEKMLDEDPKQFGLIAFRLEDQGREDILYTKRLLLDAMNATDQEKHTPQYVGGVLIIKKTPTIMKFLNDWYFIASQYIYLTDERHPNEYPEFIDHRHDQSIYSLLIKKILWSTPPNSPKPITIPDETYFAPDWDTKGDKYPIWATRTRHPV